MDVNKKVLIISHRVDRSGAPTSLLNILKGLYISHNFDVNVISMRGGELKKEFKSNCNEYYSLTDRSTTTKFINMYLIPRFIYLMFKNKDRKTVLINSLANVRAILWSFLFRKKIIIYVRESNQMISGTKLGFFRKKLLNLADEVICVSHDTKNWVSEYLKNKKKLTVIHNGVDTTAFKCKLIRKNSERIVVGIIGYLSLRKGVDRFFDIARDILKEREDIDFFVIGEITDSTYIEKFNDLISIYGTRVNISGITDKVMDYLFYNCDLTLMLSREEALPRSILESSFSGVPVVALDVAGTKEMLPDDYPYITKKPEEVKSLIYKMIQDGLHEQGEINQEYLKKDFDFNSNIEKLVKLLD